MGVTMTAYEVTLLRKLLNDIDRLVQESVVIYCDNISNIMLTNELTYHARTKHIEMHYHFVREKVLGRDIDLVYVSTKGQVANIFTKALGIEKFTSFEAYLAC